MKNSGPTPAKKANHPDLCFVRSIEPLLLDIARAFYTDASARFRRSGRSGTPEVKRDHKPEAAQPDEIRRGCGIHHQQTRGDSEQTFEKGGLTPEPSAGPDSERTDANRRSCRRPQNDAGRP